MNNYKYPWKHPDNERPYAKCYDCGMDYEDMQDMVVSDDVWEEINPTYHKGAGILCPTCIANRLNHIDKWYKTNLFLLKPCKCENNKFISPQPLLQFKNSPV